MEHLNYFESPFIIGVRKMGKIGSNAITILYSQISLLLAF